MPRLRKGAGRPQHCRSIGYEPEITQFRPRGFGWDDLEQVQLTIDELEAIRLADLEELYHQDAAGRMNVSRATFGRIIGSARKKVAEALINGKAIYINGGEVMPAQGSHRMGAGGFCICPKCLERIAHRQGIPCQEETCPKCGARMLREGSYHHDLLKEKKKDN